MLQLGNGITCRRGLRWFHPSPRLARQNLTGDRRNRSLALKESGDIFRAKLKSCPSAFAGAATDMRWRADIFPTSSSGNYHNLSVDASAAMHAFASIVDSREMEVDRLRDSRFFAKTALQNAPVLSVCPGKSWRVLSFNLRYSPSFSGKKARLIN